MKTDKQFSGFGLRFIAMIIDTIILLVLRWGLGIIWVYTPLSLFKIMIVNIISILILDASYEIILTSIYGGTVGKLFMKCKVVDPKGNYISFWRSTGRYFSKFVSALILGIGYLMIIWDIKKQGLHDKMANTFVVAKKESKVTDKVKKIATIVTIILLGGYIALQILIATMSISTALKTSFDELNLENPMQDIENKCNSSFFWSRDMCIFMYSGHVSLPEYQDRLEICSKIKTKSINVQCVSQTATAMGDKGICSHAKSSFHRRSCEKTYDFSHGMLDFFDPYKDFVFEDDGLNVSGINLGVDAGWDCVERDNTTFYMGFKDKVCFEPINVSGFEKDQDNLNHFDMDLEVRDSDGNEVIYINNAFGEKGHVFLPRNILNYRWVYTHIKHLDPGEYNYDLIIYDFVSKRGTTINGNFTISGNISDRLHLSEIMQSSSFGAIKDTLEKGEVKTYTLDNLNYEVTVLYINTADQTVRFSVNGMESPNLGESANYELVDGAELGVYNVYDLPVSEIVGRELEEDATVAVVEFYLLRR